MDITFLGQSGLHISIHNSQDNPKKAHWDVVVDPFLTGNPVAVQQAETIQADFIILTHAHADHYGDTESIAQRCDARVIANAEITAYVTKKNIRVHPMNTGGSWDFPFGRVTFTPALHSSSFADGSYGGMPMGFVLEAEGKHLYHAGDTALFNDMQLIGRRGLDIAFLPIGDNFTMGIDDAVHAAQLLRPKRVVPIHYNTFPYIEADPQDFASKVHCACDILSAGQTLSL